MKILRTILTLACVVGVVAGTVSAQQRPARGRSAAMGRGFFSAPAYGRGPPIYGVQRYNPGVRFQPYATPYGPTAPAFGGGWGEQQEFLRQGVRSGSLAPLGRVISSIREITPGRQLDAGLEYVGPRLVYRVRWITARGRRVDYIVDASTGAILSGR